ncbi:hypothetical protein [Rhizobium tropici]|uniref:Uncharacterized protein n=1 Tax=Rhizobium tropici TaxID=398 RepID=A0A329Y724_RHITR|nr:hypothetical protein [Rhizobium tropici]RAX37834.1 hypothetical protein DQ393_29520 [Rhizobium tropici]
MPGLFKWLNDFLHQKAEHNTQIRLDPSQILTNDNVTIQAVGEETYIRLWLVEMFLRDKSSWFTERYPLTYSLVEMSYGGTSIEFANVSGKNRLDIQQTDLGKSLLYNYPMTPLLPFRGGTISLDCGLVSMASDNTILKFAGVVSEFASKLGGAQIAMAAGIASSIASSVQDLLGAGKAVSKLYYHNAFTGSNGASPLASGYIWLSEGKEGKIEANRLWITSEGIRQADTKEGSFKPLEPQDYMLVRIECVAERDDYRAFAYVSDPFEQALDAKGEGDDEKGKILLRQAKRAVQKSADFTKLDAKRIIAALDEAYANDGWMPAKSSPFQEYVDPLSQAIDLVSIDRARSLPDLDELD